MKWLYRILRLFFCPHKYTTTVDVGKIRDNGNVIGNYYDKECKYCGKMKHFQFEV
jgi:hypothetical protein